MGGTTTGTCTTNSSSPLFGRCTCGASNCRRGEYCMSSSGQTVCTCNGGPGCGWGETCCQSPAGCFDLDTDESNCGACGRACPSGTNCNNGTCG
jgi:hypothetical protein